MVTDSRRTIDMSQPAVFERTPPRRQRAPRIKGPARQTQPAPAASSQGSDTGQELAAVVDILPVTLERFSDLDQLFRGDGGPFGAWGMHWREQLSCLIQARMQPRDWRFRMRKHLMTARVAPALVAYSDTKPVAWVDVGPRRHFPKFNKARASRVLGEMDLGRVWAVPSLYIAARYRGLGLSNNLIDAACTFAHRNGAEAIDAAPWDGHDGVSADVESAGLATDFARQGFKEIARRVTRRPLMRKHFSRIIRTVRTR
jgi:GNAT superfamily N-acetyltransferase